MFPKSDDKIRKDGPRTFGRRSLLATLGIAAGVAASIALGRPANADNPPPGLLAKIQIATQATTNRTVISSRVPRKPSLSRAAFRTWR